MTGPSPDQPMSAADHSRSGDDVVEAVEVAERGSAVEDLHTNPTASKPGAAPVEQVAGDPEMTEGQVVLGESADDDGGSGGDPASESSGAAQSVRGARASDLRAAGEDPP